MTTRLAAGFEALSQTAADMTVHFERLAVLRSRLPASEKEWLETQRRIAELEAS
jgi:hypothetical protein